MIFQKKASKIIIILIIIGIFITILALNQAEVTANPIISDISNITTEDHYSAYLDEHKDVPSDSEDEYCFLVSDPSLGLNDDLSSDQSYYYWIDNESIDFTVDIESSGLYLIYFTYQSTTVSHFPINLSLAINSETPFYEASQITLDTLWSDASKMKTDRYGNDVSVLQEVYSKWVNKPFRDSSRLYNDGLLFYLEEGNNSISISKISGELKLKDITIKSKPIYPSYQEYLLKHQNTSTPLIKRFEAEDMLYKNSSSINRGTSRDVGVLPFSTSKLKLNVIGIDSYQLPGDSVTWIADIETAGYYYLAFKVRQNRQNSTSYRSLYVNGEIPFLEAKHLGFSYSRKWKNTTLESLDHEQYLIYLEPNDEISLVVDSSLFVNISEKLRLITNEMTQLGLNVTKLTRNNIDKNIDWEMLDYFPDLNEKLENWEVELNEIIDCLRLLYGFKKDAQIIQDIKAAISNINKLSNNINELPRRLTLLSTGSSSAVQLLAAQIDNVITQPLVIDSFYIYTDSNELPNANANFLTKTKTSFSRFFSSFFTQSYSDEVSNEELEIWVNRSRQYVDLIQRITDDVFTEEYGIKVKVSIMNDDGKLLLANSANQQPDIALGVSSHLPIEYGMRGMLYDITQETGFQETIKVYNPEQLVPMIYDQKLYGLPETENFYVLLYRSDILTQLDLQIPDTWDDVLDMLPVLERYGMSFYVPLSNSSAFKSFDTTAPFIYQFNGRLYSDDGLTAEVDNEQTLEALSFMTDLYREYSMTTQVPSFFNSFRYGSIPIGIADFGTYLQLVNAAAEIRGLWDIAVVPGVAHQVYNPETLQYEEIINRTMPGSQQAAIIFEKSEKKEEAWEYLQWWMSTETQILFSETIVNTLGTRYLWNSANIEAFKEFSWQESHKEVILEQWTHLKEVPKIPGSYIVEREISNTWNSVVYNDVNLRSTVSDSILKMNKEINRKMKEFGYLDSKDNVVRPFNMPSANDVRRWLEDEDN